MIRLTSTRLLPATTRLRRPFPQPIRGRRLTRITARLLHPLFQLLQPTLQAHHRIKQQPNQRVFLRVTHTVEIGLGGAVDSCA